MQKLRIFVFISGLLICLQTRVWAFPQIFPSDEETKKFIELDAAHLVGLEGYIRFADESFHGRMKAAFNTTRRAVDPETFKALNWGKRYWGTTAQYARDRKALINEGEVSVEYRGQEGYFRFCDKYYPETMDRGYRNVVAILDTPDFNRLEWTGRYVGTTREYRAEQRRLATDEVRAQYQDSKGYVLYANHYYGNDMKRAYQNVSAVASPETFRQLAWQNSYAGRIEQYLADRNFLFPGDRPDSLFVGREGLIRFSERYGTSINQARRAAAAALNEREFALLDWGSIYVGSIEDYYADVKRLADNGIKYRGVEGYIRFTGERRSASMKASFAAASSILEAEAFKALKWGSMYPGSLPEYRAEREQLLRDGRPRSEYTGSNGYRQYAIEHHDGDMNRAFAWASGALADSEFSALKWEKTYRGKAYQYDQEASRLIGPDGPIARYVGFEGYARYANDHYDGSMAKAAQNASLVLDRESLESLQWGRQFRGTVSDRNAHRQFMLNDDGRIDYDRWFGKTDGLRKVVFAFAKALNLSKPYRRNELDLLRTRFRSAVAPEELSALGWISADQVKPDKPVEVPEYDAAGVGYRLLCKEAFL